MKIQSAKFIISNTDYKLCPKENLPEYAFIGRSNVGKSSLINSITERKNLAKTSGTPGKTRLINHFLINQNWYLVDLPGYGYARTSKKKREEFEKIIQDYLSNRTSLICLFVLIDIRHKPQKIDQDFIRNLGKKSIPFVITFTKSDKISKNKAKYNVELYKNHMKEEWNELPKIFISSSKDNTGKNEILSFIDYYNKKHVSNP